MSLAEGNREETNYCPETSLPKEKTVILDGEQVKVCLACEYDAESSQWTWGYRAYNCPGSVIPDNG
jgi:hypothetical protein